MKCYLIVVLISISLVSHHVEHLFVDLLAIPMSLEKCIFKTCARFYVRLFSAVDFYEFLMYFSY